MISITSNATTTPLTSMGLISERYMGTTNEAMPTPKPVTTLPTIRIGMVGARAMMSAPAVKRMSAKITTGLRPTESERGPAINAPTSAPS